ncbi:uncharacterized protein V6R79_021049 [Siganus canaliculatus]
MGAHSCPASVPSRMETDDCCCCRGEAGGLRENTVIQFLRQKEARLQRMARFIAAVLVLLAAMVLVSLVVVLHGFQGHRSAEFQIADPGLGSPKPTVQSVTHSSGISVKQQQPKALKNPSAMLTVPVSRNIKGELLEWDSEEGHAFCHGGFNYSSGNLIIPRNGFYRVFLQITYESTTDLKCDKLILSHTVYLFRAAYAKDRPLLSAVDTVMCSMEPWTKSFYTSGLFFLEANCKLRVKSTNPDLIVKKEYLVFFGAELVTQ